MLAAASPLCTNAPCSADEAFDLATADALPTDVELAWTAVLDAVWIVFDVADAVCLVCIVVMAADFAALDDASIVVFSLALETTLEVADFVEVAVADSEALEVALTFDVEATEDSFPITIFDFSLKFDL